MTTPTSIPPHPVVRRWKVDRVAASFGPVPRLMGIVNVTPDSFSDGGQYVDPDRAVTHGLELVAAGADLLDVGGESTRPGSVRVSAHDELQRVLPVVERLAATAGVPISIDTMKATVAEQALKAGATIVNDVSGLSFDERMAGVCAGSECGIILMHMQGTPETMQQAPHYEHVVDEIVDFFAARLSDLSARGIDPERVVVDPGIGFGKTASHNLEILSHVQQLHGLGRPVLIGHSRKRFLGRLLGRAIEERAAGTVGVAIALAEQGVEILRVHDVAAVKDALTAWQAIRSQVDATPAR